MGGQHCQVPARDAGVTLLQECLREGTAALAWPGRAAGHHPQAGAQMLSQALGSRCCRCAGLALAVPRPSCAGSAEARLRAELRLAPRLNSCARLHPPGTVILWARGSIS